MKDFRDNYQQMDEHTQQQQDALRVLHVLLAATGIITVVYYYLAWQFQSWQILSMATLLLAFGGVCFISRRFIRTGRIPTAINLVILGMFIIFPVSSTLISGLGVILGLSLVALTLAITLQTVSGTFRTRSLFLSILIGMLTLALDQFGGDYRLALPGLQPFIGALAGGVILIYAYFIIRAFPNYSLRIKLIIAFLLVSLLSGGVVIAVTTSTIRTNLLQDIGDNLNNVATTRALGIGDLLSRQTDLLDSLALNTTIQTELAASSPQASLAELEAIDQQWRAAADSDPLIQNSLTNDLAHELNNFQQRFPQHVEIFLTDQQGALLATTNRTSDYYQADEGWWQNAFNQGQGMTFINQPEFDESSNTIGMQMAVPIIINNTVVGVLRSTYEIDALTNLLTAPAQSELLAIDLYLPNNQEITLEGGELVLEEDEGYEQWQALAVSDDSSLQIEHNDVPSIVSTALVNDAENRSEVAELGWTIVTIQPESIGLAAITQQQRNTILFGMGVVMLSIVAALLISQYLTQPITTLADAVEQVRSGDLTVRVPIASGDELGALSFAFNDMTNQLEQSIGQLDRRNRAIETSTAVGRQLSTILDPQRLTTEVVQQVQQAFNYYHAHIYLLDESGQTLNMAGGTGEAGSEMLASGHTIPIGKGLVGRAAATQATVLVADVSQEEGWLPNPLLPETKSEAAVPIMRGDELLGVLDVQHNVIDGLRQLDIEMLQTVANQFAIGLYNARSLMQAQQNAEQEHIVNEISQKIENATTIEDVLNIAARELRQTIGAKHTIVELSNPSLNNLN